MQEELLKASLRQQAVYVPAVAPAAGVTTVSPVTAALVANLARLGYGVSEPLLRALESTTPEFQNDLLAVFREVMGISKSWLPLVKGWDVPTGESWVDHLLTWFAQQFPAQGTRLPCGHLIPANAFPLERYNGCPFCGTPFGAAGPLLLGQGSKLKVLDIWTPADAEAFLRSLLLSKTALDATQQDSLRLLLAVLPLPAGVPIAMKETRMAVIDSYVARQQPALAQPLFSSPTDVLRYLWFKHTGFLQLVEPKTIRHRHQQNSTNLVPARSQRVAAGAQALEALKLKYSRRDAAMVADWLNALPQSPLQQCEIMHPKRGMWVRFIRALRLAEYSQRAGRTRLRETLDRFYRQDYPVWQGQVEQARLRTDATRTLALLQQRPGLFARSLFANMLWFGPEPVVAAFRTVLDQVPARLLFTLSMYAEAYFDPRHQRTVKPLGGTGKRVPAHPLLSRYAPEQLTAMREQVTELALEAVRRRFAAQPTTGRTIFIDPTLRYLPVAIGDRSETVQDLPAALMGTRFAVEGDAVRLFLQWGTGLPAQHLDMDLSCRVAYDNRVDYCAFNQLTTTGCKHSGDIQSIPDKVGTAEYIELDLPALEQAEARYVVFTCNAYTNGALSPNLVVGWMSSAQPMRISRSSGVAYDPSCVQHQVRVTQPLSKGLVFGVLVVERREVVWLELPFAGQLTGQLDVVAVEGLLRRLEAKLSVGTLLHLKAEAQGLQLVETPEAADEAYTREWARNPAAVTQLLPD
ncbi:hypothetical protein [Hymenobacter rigui]|uniref:Prokaryotic RING finger family 4 n=1 Tax=Hymenobacter rigui TaxID=334424 RepID=A0A3R9MNW0_9BACT|nr:hypothetical protein [Hymenobacter rigui]RSK50178.1 hypothetical protein EI291_05870 [Hymenobacter rigui]